MQSLNKKIERVEINKKITTKIKPYSLNWHIKAKTTIIRFNKKERKSSKQGSNISRETAINNKWKISTLRII